jgi:hypothetical protein
MTMRTVIPKVPVQSDIVSVGWEHWTSVPGIRNSASHRALHSEISEQGQEVLAPSSFLKFAEQHALYRLGWEMLPSTLGSTLLKRTKMLETSSS